MSAYFDGDLHPKVELGLQELTSGNVISRIWDKDHTVWCPEPTEISNRLGWLESPTEMLGHLGEIKSFVDDVRSDGITHGLLLGMGGSSLAPEVFRYIFGVREGYVDLSVLDSTDPGAVLRKAKNLDPVKTLFIVSTKSGGTIETLSLFKYFYNFIKDKVGEEQAGSHFVAITDPGSQLCDLAKQLGFRKTFVNNPDIGGRYSALSHFGLVPAALLGVDIAELIDRTQKMISACKQPDPTINSGARLGVFMGQAALAGRDKVTLMTSKAMSYLGVWIEQLVAESTGKNGKGILPVDLETVSTPEVYANDRLFVYIKMGKDSDLESHAATLRDAGHPVAVLDLMDEYDIGAEMFRWEFATVIASERLKINPFDQPDVESAKVLAKRMMTAYQEGGELPSPRASLETDHIDVFGSIEVEDLDEAMIIFFADANTGPGTSSARSYVAIQAYLQPTAEIETALQNLRHHIRDQFKLATTVGFGPRFLHSTGQLHKGDQGNGLFIQITADAEEDAGIPDEPGSDKSRFSFHVLKTAQALGDHQALLDKGRKAIRFHLKGDLLRGIESLQKAI